LAAENDGLRLVATDSYRLAVRDLPGTSVLRTDQKVLVPSRALNELARLLPSSGEVTLRLGERDATFEVGGARLSTRLIEGEFPNYRQLIPQQYPNRLTVGREPLLDAVRRVKLLARDSTPIRLSMSPDALDLTATTQDIGQAAESLDAKYEGAEMVVAFNPDYLSAGVDAVTADEVVLETLDAMKPAVLRAGEASDFLYLLMPVRVP
jgi:DNA polymerase-3 subunit beta